MAVNRAIGAPPVGRYDTGGIPGIFSPPAEALKMKQSKPTHWKPTHRARVIAIALLFAGGFAAHAEDKVLNVTNWGEYIGEDTITNFEEEFGYKVVYDTYDSVESIDSKLLAGNTGYDVVSHAGSNIARLIPAGIVQKLDRSKLPNFKHIREDIMHQLSSNWDPGNAYIVPYMWGTHGVTYTAPVFPYARV